MYKMRSFFIVFAFFLSFLVFSKAEASVISPTITESKNGYTQNGVFDAKPYVAGSTATGTEILVYFDGTFAGLATVASGTNAFSYQHAASLAEGAHSVMVLARDKTSLVLSAPSFSQIVVVPIIVPVPVPAPAPTPVTTPTSTPTSSAKIIAAPTLISPKENMVTGSVKPVITGLVPSGTSVLVYVDGVYNGKVANLNHKSGTANFAYKPFLNLRQGSHSVWAVAEKNGQKSAKSNAVTFRVEAPMPAPTLFKPVVNSKTVATKPFIVGVAKNDSLVKVYIDNKLSGEVRAGQHKSGVVGFAYQPKTDLTNGNHATYTVASDSRGKVSSKSNVVKFTVGQPAPVKAKTEVKKDPKKDESVAKNDKKQEQKTEVKPEENKKKVSLNLIIFIAFLIGVIGWIIWVNKELVKEKMKNE